MRLLFLALCLSLVNAVPLDKKRASSLERNILNTRIIGGTLATPGQFPWQVAIFIDNENGSFFCGGALIDQKWVLTSGRCADGATGITLILGTTSLSSGGIVIEATYSVAHPDYNSVTLDNDIGLIRIDDTIELSSNIQVVPLAVNELGSDIEVTVSGWGASEGSRILNGLNFVNLKSISNAECKFSYGMIIPDEMVCAVGNRNTGICTGDSGDPLIMKDSEGKPVLVGTAGWASAGGCSTAEPSGYLRTAAYRNWIRSVISS